MFERVKFGDVLTQSWVDGERGATIARNASLDTVLGLTAKEATEKSLGATKAALAQRPDVVDAALGNSQYARHFEEDYGWLVQTFEWRSYLKRIDPAAGPVLPGTAPVPSWYESTATGLRYGPDDGVNAAIFDTRVGHELNHTRRIQRADGKPHGVMETASPFKTLDDVYLRRGSQTGSNIDVRIESGFTIPPGGSSTGLYPRQPCTRLAVSGVNVITAFPWPTCP